MQKYTGLKRIGQAGVYSFNGWIAALRHESAFRQELFLAVLFLPIAMLIDVTRTERVILVIVTIFVLIVELLNSAVEAVVDRIGVEHHELSGRAKDLGSAAVMTSLLLWLYVWGEIVVLGKLL
ncbi:diacylglycerol kinase [Granulosicoccus sp.]|nr:diacylglycerol kinase [Granulosicoccus sp.]